MRTIVTATTREASGSDRSVGSLEFDDSPLGSACAEGDGDDDEACGRGGGHRRRRGEKRAWSLDEERAFYETYSRSGGRMDVVASTLGGAPFYRDKTLVYKFRMNAGETSQAVLKSYLSVDAKNSKRGVRGVIRVLGVSVRGGGGGGERAGVRAEIVRG